MVGKKRSKREMMERMTGQKTGRLTRRFFLFSIKNKQSGANDKKEPIKKFISIFSLNTNKPINTPIGMVV